MRRLALLVSLICLISAVPALSLSGPDVGVSVAKYDPLPAEPGKYVTVWLKAENSGGDTANNVVVELLPEYPFSLDPGENALRKIGILGGNDYQIVKYKILVDENAVDGENDLKVRYSACDFCVSVTEDLPLTVAKTTNTPELEIIRGTAKPAPYPGGTSELSFDLVNIAPGTAYYILVEISSDVATIDPEEIYIGNLEADDIDSLDFTATFKNVEPGTYPIDFKIRYKDSEYDEFVKEETVDLELRPKSEVATEATVPLQVYAVYIIAAVVVVWLLRKKGWLIFRKKKESL